MGVFKYTYHLQINDGPMRLVEIHHTNEHERAKQRVDGKRFHRLDINQPFIIGPKGGYREILEGGLENVYRVKITEHQGDISREYYRGKFVKTDCDIDEDNLTVTVKLESDDRYSDYLEQVDTELDLLKIGVPKQSINYTRYPVLQLYGLGGGAVTNTVDGVFSEATVEPVYTEFSMRDELNFSEATKLLYIPYREDYPEDISGLYYPTTERLNSALEENYRRGAGGYTMEMTNGVTWRISDDAGNTVADSIDAFSDIINGVYSGLPNGVIPAIKFVADPGVVAIASFIGLHGRWSLFETSNWPTPVFPPVQGDQFALGEIYNRTSPYGMAVIPWEGYSEEDQGYGKYPEGGTYANAGKFILPPAANQPDLIYIPVARSTWYNVSWWVLWGLGEQVRTDEQKQIISLADAYPLSGVIRSMLGEISPGVTFEGDAAHSQLLYAPVNPVTGESQVELFITPVSNVVVFDYDEAASVARLKFSELLEFLEFAYQGQEFIDDEGRFRIEAAAFFEGGRSYSDTPNVGWNLVRERNPYTGRSWASETNRYTFLKENLPERMIFSWATDVSQSFAGEDIVVKNAYVAKGVTEERKVTKFTTDLQYASLRPSAFPASGSFFVLACRREGERYVVARSEVAGYGSLQNGALSWPYLHENFYRHNMPGSSLEINGRAVVASSVRKVRQQQIEAPVPSDFNVLELVRTGVGDGELEASVENMESKLSANTLLHGND